MLLKIKGFRQHKDLTLEFPDQGLVLLSGKSGSGKSSILDAIEECIYGEGQDVYDWGGVDKRVMVDVSGFAGGFAAKRTRGPNSLSFKSSADITESFDDAAQEFINGSTGIGMSFEEFSASSYIKQGQHNSLLSLGSSDQLRFIQRLSSGDFDPDAFKDYLSEEIRGQLLKQETISKDISNLQKQSEIIQNSIDSIGVQIEPVSPEMSESICDGTIISINEEIFDIEYQLQQKKQIFNKINLQAIKTKELDRYKANVANLFEQDVNITTEIISIELDLISLPSKEEISKNLDIINGYALYNNTKAELMNIASEIRAAYIDATDNLTKFLSDVLSSNKNEIVNLLAEQNYLDNQIKEISRYNDPKDCPYCAGKVYIISNHLHTSPVENISERVIKLKEDLSLSKKELEVITNECNKLQNWLNLSQNIKTRMIAQKPSEPMPLESKESLSDSLTGIFVLHNRLKAAKFSKDKIDASIKETVRLIGSIKGDIEDLSEVSIEDINNEIGELSNKLIELNKEISLMDGNILLIKRYKEQYIAYTKNINIINKLTKDLASITNEIEEKTLVSSGIHSKISDLIIIKAAAERAAMASIEEVIDLINTNAQNYIDMMFPDSGTVVTLQNLTKTQKGDERAKISLDIYHKGKKAKKFNSLSGGEKSRITLAFQLGLSDLYNSPILLVDEGFTGIDKETQEECFKVLREYADKSVVSKLVIVVEHGAPEHLFDSIVYV